MRVRVVCGRRQLPMCRARWSRVLVFAPAAWVACVGWHLRCCLRSSGRGGLPRGSGYSSCALRVFSSYTGAVLQLGVWHWSGGGVASPKAASWVLRVRLRHMGVPAGPVDASWLARGSWCGSVSVWGVGEPAVSSFCTLVFFAAASDSLRVREGQVLLWDVPSQGLLALRALSPQPGCLLRGFAEGALASCEDVRSVPRGGCGP